MDSINIILIVLAIWLLLLTGAFVWALTFFGRLTKGVKEGNLIKVLDQVLTTESKNTTQLKDVFSKLRSLEKQMQVYIQKIGLVRFNPFKETGGDHSFSLALLDAKNTGLIITGLHTRDRTRIYIKSIVAGQSEHKLSKEEQKALANAK